MEVKAIGSNDHSPNVTDAAFDLLVETRAAVADGETAEERAAGFVDATEVLATLEAETRQAIVTLRRDREILEALRTYPPRGRYTKRKGWPWLRALRKHAGLRITRAERKRLWPAIEQERGE